MNYNFLFSRVQVKTILYYQWGGLVHFFCTKSGIFTGSLTKSPYLRVENLESARKPIRRPKPSLPYIHAGICSHWRLMQHLYRRHLRKRPQRDRKKHLTGWTSLKWLNFSFFINICGECDGNSIVSVWDGLRRQLTRRSWLGRGRGSIRRYRL